MNLLSVESVFCYVLGYPMSYVEFVGTTLYLTSVWMVARRNIWTWPVGIVSVIAFAAIYYQLRLYADALEQIYYVGASLYGWWHWSSSRSAAEPVEVSYSHHRALLAWGAFTSAAAVFAGFALTRVHRWSPSLFPEPAAFPYVDGLTTVMSLVAMWLMAQKRIESWVYWIAVDAAAVWLYFEKGVKFIALLYVVLLCMAAIGLFRWHAGKNPQPPSH